jgi:Flp pilus assembly CpaF family ATPase
VSLPTATDLARVIATALADDRVRRHQSELPAASPDEERLLARETAEEFIRIDKSQQGWGHDFSSEIEERRVVDDAIARVLGLGKLEPLLDDDEVSDIHVRGNRPVWLKMRNGERCEAEPIVDTDDELVDLIRRIASRMGHREQRFDPAHPELNLQLRDGSRVFATMDISSRPSLIVRRHRFDYSHLAELVSRNMLTAETAQFLAAAVRSKHNIIVAGGTGSGKTTLLRALINEIPRTERIVTIEDAFELGIDRFEDAHPDHDALQSRASNMEGTGAVSMSDLARMALRMDPDRVVIGEVRGSEAFPMLLAMSQGNNGSMCTIHADSPRNVFPKLLAYVAMAQTGVPADAINLLISTSVHFVIHVQLIGDTRTITSIHEVVQSDGGGILTNEIFSRTQPQHNFVSLRLATQEVLEEFGFSFRRTSSWAS